MPIEVAPRPESITFHQWTGTGNRYGLTASGSEATSLTTAAVVNLSAGETISAYMAMWTSGESTAIWTEAGNIVSAVWLSD